MIESCWGHSKHVYQEYPTSSSEADLKVNLLRALGSVPLPMMHWYVLLHSFVDMLQTYF